jgi:hypothetical protein
MRRSKKRVTHLKITGLIMHRMKDEIHMDVVAVSLDQHHFQF